MKLSRIRRFITWTLAIILVYLLIRLGAGAYKFNQAQKLINSDQVSQSYQLQQQAILLNPLSARYRRQYALTNLSMATALSNQVELSPTDKETAATLIQQALREALVATELSPNQVENWRLLGQIYENLIGVVPGTDQKAIQAYLKAVEIDNNDLESYLGMARSNEKAKKYPASLELYQQLLTKLIPGSENYVQVENKISELENLNQ